MFVHRRIVREIMNAKYNGIRQKGCPWFENGPERGCANLLFRLQFDAFGGGTHLLARVKRRWWAEEFEELRAQQQEEVKAETAAAYQLAAKRGERYKENRTP